MTPWLRLTENTARIVVADIEELRRAERKLHAHLAFLLAGVLVAVFLVTLEAGEALILMSMWGLSSCQEYIDYAGRL